MFLIRGDGGNLMRGDGSSFFGRGDDIVATENRTGRLDFIRRIVLCCWTDQETIMTKDDSINAWVL